MTMSKYIGTKIIQAEPITRGDYNKFRGWQIPEDENPDDVGYKVVHSDDYVSWSPAADFEEAYKPCDSMNFGLAIEAMKKGLKVARKGWNGKGMFLFIASGDDMSYCLFYNEMICIDSIVMKTADDKLCIGWLASQADMLSEDWVIVE